MKGPWLRLARYGNARAEPEAAVANLYWPSMRSSAPWSHPPSWRTTGARGHSGWGLTGHVWHSSACSSRRSGVSCCLLRCTVCCSADAHACFACNRLPLTPTGKGSMLSTLSLYCATAWHSRPLIALRKTTFHWYSSTGVAVSCSGRPTHAHQLVRVPVQVNTLLKVLLQPFDEHSELSGDLSAVLTAAPKTAEKLCVT